MKKRILSFLLTVAMLFSLLPATAFAVGSGMTFTVEGTSANAGDTITVKLTYETSLAGFGDFELPFEVSVSSSGLSRIYWK